MSFSDKQIDVIVDTYSDMIVRVAFSHTQNREDARDIAQEVFMSLITARVEINDEEHLKSWLLRATLNRCKNLVKRVYRNRDVELSEAMAHTDETSPETKDLFEALRGLSQEERTVIHLYHYEGYEISEIAAQLGMRKGAVQMRLVRTRQKLKRFLEEDI